MNDSSLPRKNMTCNPCSILYCQLKGKVNFFVYFLQSRSLQSLNNIGTTQSHISIESNYVFTNSSPVK